MFAGHDTTKNAKHKSIVDEHPDLLVEGSVSL
jgi:hypothetical protein